MSSPLNLLFNSLLKSGSSKSDNVLGKALIKGIVEKQLSPFKLLINTEFGKVSVNSKIDFKQGEKIQLELTKTKNSFVLKSLDKKISISPKDLEKFIKTNPKILNQVKIFNGVVEKRTALPKFIVTTDLGKIEVETEKFFNKGDVLKLSTKDVREQLAGKSQEILKDFDNRIKPRLKEILTIIRDNPKDSSKDIFSLLKKLPKKEFDSIKKSLFKKFINPEKITPEDIKKGIKYFFGSSSKDFKNDLIKFKEILEKNEILEKEVKLKTDLKNISTKGNLLENISEMTDKTSKGFESLKSLNLIKYAESSKLYFFLPLMVNDFESAEFFLDLEEKNRDKKENQELRALIKLNMSRLGTIRADLRLINEKNLKVFFGTQDKSSLDIIENGFKLLEKNLKKAGFQEILLKVDILKSEEMEEPLSRKLIETETSEYVFDLMV